MASDAEAFGVGPSSGPFAAADGFYASATVTSQATIAAPYLRPSLAGGAGAYGAPAFGAGAGASIEDYENEAPLLEGAPRS